MVSDFVVDNTDLDKPYIERGGQSKHVIHIIGASGAGTTTLGKAIGEAFSYIHLDTDDYFWEQTNPPFTQKRPREERQRLLGRDIARYDKCVISGTLDVWGDIFIPLFNLVIYVYTPTETRIERLKQREYQRFGDRILPDGDMYDNHREFIEWSALYDTAGLEQRSHKLHTEWLKKVICPVIKVDGTRPINELLGEINEIISSDTIGGRYCDKD